MGRNLQRFHAVESNKVTVLVVLVDVVVVETCVHAAGPRSGPPRFDLAIFYYRRY